MSNENWASQANEALKRFILWWESDSPDRRMNFQEAHEMGNLILVAKFLVDDHQARKAEDPEEK